MPVGRKISPAGAGARNRLTWAHAGVPLSSPLREDVVKKVVALFLPEGALLVATVVMLSVPSLKNTVPDFARFYPAAVFAVGVLLAWRFGRSRLLFALLALALASWAVRRSFTPIPDAVAARITFQATALLLPLNLAVIGLVADRGLLTSVGLVRFGALAIQVALVDLFRRTAGPATVDLLTKAILPARLFTWTPLGQMSLLAFVLAFAVTIAFAPSPTRRGFAWAIAAAFAAFHAHRPGPGSALYFGTAGLMLVAGVIEASYLLAYQDGLTALPARRALGEALQRLSGLYTVAMVDVDHFKQFNDRYGHDIGDQVLRMVATKLAAVEGGGRAYRYGGEEFAIVFPGKSLEHAVPHLEAVRKKVGEGKFTIRRRLRPRKKPEAPPRRRRREEAAITISLGVAATDQRRTTPEQVIEAADEALYTAKADGRNRLRAADTKAAVR
jgi:diguanylate cyclase (GGDEF)-like protein